MTEERPIDDFDTSAWLGGAFRTVSGAMDSGIVQAPARLRDDALPRAGQEPRAAVHAVRAQQLVSGSTKTAGVRTSLSEICQTADTAAKKRRNRPSTTRGAVPRSDHAAISARPYP